jgi:hypothetical protein
VPYPGKLLNLVGNDPQVLFSLQLRKMIRKANIRVKDLADATEVPEDYIRNLLRGEAELPKSPSEFLDLLLEALHASEEDANVLVEILLS